MLACVSMSAAGQGVTDGGQQEKSGQRKQFAVYGIVHVHVWMGSVVPVVVRTCTCTFTVHICSMRLSNTPGHSTRIMGGEGKSEADTWGVIYTYMYMYSR